MTTTVLSWNKKCKEHLRIVDSRADHRVRSDPYFSQSLIWLFFKGILHVNPFISDDTVYFCVCDFCSPSTSVVFHFRSVISDSLNVVLNSWTARLKRVMNESLTRVSSTQSVPRPRVSTSPHFHYLLVLKECPCFVCAIFCTTYFFIVSQSLDKMSSQLLFMTSPRSHNFSRTFVLIILDELTG